MDLPWTAEMVGLTPADLRMPSRMPGVNVMLTRSRLARFLEDFSEDADVREFLMLDLLAFGAGAEIGPAGAVEDLPSLASHPAELWEAVWLYKVLGMHGGGRKILFLGSPASHLVLQAGLAGNNVVAMDPDSDLVEAGRRCAEILGLRKYRSRIWDLNGLSRFADGAFDTVVCASALDRLPAEDQEAAAEEIARILKPNGMAGLTFHCGPAPRTSSQACNAPKSAREAHRRYARGGLRALGNRELEPAAPGALFSEEAGSQALASLFLGKFGRRRAPALDLPSPRISGTQSPGSAVKNLAYLLFRNGARLRGETGEDRRPACIDSSREAGRSLAGLGRLATERIDALARAEAALRNEREETAKRARALLILDAEVKARDERIEQLERVAADRLVVLGSVEASRTEVEKIAHQRAALIKQLVVELEAREAVVQVLARAANERLEMIEKLEAKARVFEKIAHQRAALVEQLTVELEAREARVQVLEKAANERLEVMEELAASLRETLFVRLSEFAVRALRIVRRLCGLKHVLSGDRTSPRERLRTCRATLDLPDVDVNRVGRYPIRGRHDAF